MFILEGKSSDTAFVLNQEGTFTIGRTTANLRITHSSVSRKHAEITVKDNAVYLRDCNSKYLTRCNGKIILLDQEIKLNNGCELTFGEVTFIFRVKENIVTCSSGLKDIEQNLITIIKKLGGSYLKDWNETCTHLTTNEIVVTLKVLHAILDNKPIVTTQYWHDYLKNIEINKLPPDPKEYYPSLGENVVNPKYFEFNSARYTLFKGKTFILWNKKNHLKIQGVIEKTGGKCVIMERNTKFGDLLSIINECIIIDPEDEKLEQSFSNILHAYKSRGRRLIPVQEFVLAVVQCSCRENCNPEFDRARAIFSKPTQQAGSSKLVVAETETQCFDIENDEKPHVIPESNDVDYSVEKIDSQPASSISTIGTVLSKKKLSTQSNNLKKVRDEDDLVLNPVKRAKLDPTVENSPMKGLAPNFKRSSEVPCENVNKRVKRSDSSSSANPFMLRINPLFSKVKNEVKVSSKNPFELSNVNIQESKLNENINKLEVIQIDDDEMERKPQQTFHRQATKKKRRFAESATIDFSSIKHNVTDGIWLDSSVKNEVECKNTNISDEEKGWCEKLNNSIAVIVKDLITDFKDDQSIRLNISSNGSKNFKKFRKVPVPKSNFILQCSRKSFGASNLGIDYGLSDDENSKEM